MTIPAANAFLKTFEESSDNIIIIATTSNRALLLDTIISRAFIVKFELPSHDIVIDCLKKSYSDVNIDKLNLITSFSMNRI
jgi:DNA polymerase III delta prime subunit